ncbi:MAG: hypothetical protein EPN86_02945 [Nanoarchaeota archaeon]|nr:MAG: hypothetical protein EPN86_02945 [Nanoarchaeota archaeon]
MTNDGYSPMRTVNYAFMNYLAGKLNPAQAAEIIVGTLGINRIVVSSDNSFRVDGTGGSRLFHMPRRDDPVTEDQMRCLGVRLQEQIELNGDYR